MSIGDIPKRLDGSAVYADIPGGYTVAVSFGANIRRLRRRREMNQTTLGKRVGVKQGAVSKWESGESEPAASDLPRIAIALKVPVDSLLTGIDPEYDVLVQGEKGSAAVTLLGDSEIAKPGVKGATQVGGTHVASSRLQQRQLESFSEEIAAAADRLNTIAITLMENSEAPGTTARGHRGARKTRRRHAG